MFRREMLLDESKIAIESKSSSTTISLISFLFKVVRNKAIKHSQTNLTSASMTSQTTILNLLLY